MSPQQKMEILRQNIEQIIARVKVDPWFFCTNFVWTLDTHDAINPKKKIPNKDYLRIVTEEWSNSSLIAVPKSRQMMISWLMVALHYWTAAYHHGRFVFFQSKKEEDADVLLDRALFIHNNVPDWLRPTGKKSYCNFVFPMIDSQIKAVSQSPDAIRMHTASAILSDESAFQPYARDAYAAAKPTIDGGGKLTLISTANFKEFFYNIVHDIEY